MNTCIFTRINQTYFKCGPNVIPNIYHPSATQKAVDSLYIYTRICCHTQSRGLMDYYQMDAATRCAAVQHVDFVEPRAAGRVSLTLRAS